MLKEAKDAPTPLGRETREDAAQLRAHVLWSPHGADEFVYASSNLRLYQSLGDIEPIPKNMELSKHMEEARFFLPRANEAKSARFNLIHTVALSKQEYYPCLAWGLEATQPHLLVAGLHTGQTVLLQMAGQDSVVKEFGPSLRQNNARRCNAVAWNPKNLSQFASGLERSERAATSACVFLWDVNQSSAEPRSRDFNAQAVESVSDAVCQLSIGETCKSLAWRPDQPNSLVVGTSVKNLKIFDVLSNSRSASMNVRCHTKAVLGVKFDPFQGNRFATFSDDGSIKIWDFRQLRHTVPVTDIAVNERVVQVEWNTSRPGMLASCSRGESYLRLWDVESNGKPVTGNDKVSCRLRDTSMPLGAFAWHPVHKQRLLTATIAGGLEDFHLFDAVPIAFAVDNSFALALNETISVHNPAFHLTLEVLEHDISTIMKRRASMGYSVTPQKNVTVLQEISHPTHAEAQKAWQWLHDWAPESRATKPTALRGISALLSQGSASVLLPFTDPILSCFKVYWSEARSQAIRMCGWWQVLATPSDSNPSFEIGAEKANYENFLRTLEARQQFEKAAALALFHLDLERALLSLSKGSDTNKHLGFIALALSGCSYSLQGEKSHDNTRWQNLHKSSLQTLSPYLQAAFAFFCAPLQAGVSASEFYRSVLFSDMELTERISFACRFLPDVELNTFLADCTDLGMRTGSLETLALTGLDKEGLQVLQSYVNRTADIQTTALLACYSTAYFPSPEQRATRWVEEYCDVLNAWKMWTIRAKFDVNRAALNAHVEASRADPHHQESKLSHHHETKEKESKEHDSMEAGLGPQVYLRCNYCGQSLSKTDMSDGRLQAGRLGRMPKRLNLATTRIRGCPACKHPLPRCALCLEPFDCATPAPDSLGKVRHGETSTWDNGSMHPFDKWFTWCLGCRHGGHAHHIAQWFATHAECPVVDCVCHCNSIDVLSRAQKLRVPGSTHQSPPRRRSVQPATPLFPSLAASASGGNSSSSSNNSSVSTGGSVAGSVVGGGVASTGVSSGGSSSSSFGGGNGSGFNSSFGSSSHVGAGTGNVGSSSGCSSSMSSGSSSSSGNSSIGNSSILNIGNNNSGSSSNITNRIISPSPSLSALTVPPNTSRASALTLSSITSNTALSSLLSASSSCSSALSGAASPKDYIDQVSCSPHLSATASWSSGSSSESHSSPEPSPATIHTASLPAFSLPSAASLASSENDALVAQVQSYSETVQKLQLLQQQQQELAAQLEQRARANFAALAQVEKQEQQMTRHVQQQQSLIGQYRRQPPFKLQPSGSSSHISMASPSPPSPRLMGASPPRSSSKSLLSLQEVVNSPAQPLVGSFTASNGESQVRSVSEPILKLDD